MQRMIGVSFFAWRIVTSGGNFSNRLPVPQIVPFGIAYRVLFLWFAYYTIVTHLRKLRHQRTDIFTLKKHL
jgi:hypothetical protein